MTPQEDEAARGSTLARVADLCYENLPATPDQLLPLRHRLAHWATHTGLARDDVDNLILAADEAVSNVIVHAYPHHPGTFDLRASQEPRDGTVHLTVRDHGRWRPPPADPGPLHGRGLILIHALTHHTTIEHTVHGTTVHMTWLLPATNHSPQ